MSFYGLSLEFYSSFGALGATDVEGDLVTVSPSFEMAQKSLIRLLSKGYSNVEGYKTLEEKVEFGLEMLDGKDDDCYSIDSRSIVVSLRLSVYDNFEDFISHYKTQKLCVV